MSASNQVGFSIQGDVVGGASLMYSASGRLLKSLSDGGIDFYAVAASVQLGRTIPITASQELMVSRLLASRGGRQGFLAKALHIGWGHSDFPMELARTRAGSGALLLISALNVGGSTFDAAVALQELFLLNGCEASMLPNVDVLLTMVRYVTPFMYNSGFQSILQNIHGAVSKACASRNAESAIGGLSAVGEPSEWAKAVKRLVSAAEGRENIFLIVRQRGAWLAALAVHVLGMAVDVRMLGETVWQAAGTQGSAVMFLPTQSSEVPVSTGLEIVYVDAPVTNSGHNWITLDCPMSESLSTILDADPRITAKIDHSVHLATYRTAISHVRTTALVWDRAPVENVPYSRRMSDNFVDLVAQACVNLGIRAPAEEGNWPRGRVSRNIKIRHPGLYMLEDHQLHEIYQACGLHDTEMTNWEHRYPETIHPFSYDTQSTYPIGDCLCCKLGNLIHACAATAFALAPCKYDPSELRVQQQVISGEVYTDLAVAMSENEMDLLSARIEARPSKITMPASARTTGDENEVTWLQLMDHLHILFHNSPTGGLVSRHGHRSNVLAISAGHTTIYQKVLLDNECFTPQGQVLEITTGRLSLNKVLRDTVEESALVPRPKDISLQSVVYKTPSWSRVAPHHEIKPHFVEGPVHAAIDTSLTEDAIRVACHISTAEEHISDINLSKSIDRLMACRTPLPRSCTHDFTTPVKPESLVGGTWVVAAFCCQPMPPDRDTHVFYALKGRGLEQLVQASLLPLNSTFLQVGACLACTIRPAEGASLPNRASWDLNEKAPRSRGGNLNIIMIE